MRRELGHALLKIGVHVELRRLSSRALLLGRPNDRVAEVHLAQVPSELGVLRQALGANVARSCERRLGVGHVAAHEAQRGSSRRLPRDLLPHQLGERPKALFARDDTTRTPFRFERKIEILELGLGPNRLQPPEQLGRQLALLVDFGDDAAAPPVELHEVSVPAGYRTDLHLVEAARRFLSVPCDERHRRALAQEAHDGSHAAGPETELGSDHRH
jgi:hypothetical protein